MADVRTEHEIRRDVMNRYAEAARGAGRQRATSDCCDDGCCGTDAGAWGAARYEDGVLGEAPDEAIVASLGCGNPTAVAELQEGEVVLDLGSGGGLDVILSARRVGPSGKAYGVDMTEEMLALALRNRERAGVSNVEFLKGHIEDVPLPSGTVDVVISNCVVNLSADKARVFQEMFRVLRPGGRVAVMDVVADRPADQRPPYDPALWSACIAGALTREAYRDGLLAAGFEDVEILDSHSVAEGFGSALVRARKLPSGPAVAWGDLDELDEVRPGCC